MTKDEQLSAIEQAIRSNLQTIGEDIGREGLLKTPKRVAKAMLELTSGYEADASAVLNSAKFAERCNKMIVVKDIEFYSLCEHHILPFFGKAHVAYIPDGYITGLSKIPRVVNIFSHRLQVQERLTKQICDCIQESLNPKGVIVVLEAQHLCMQMRGVEKQGAYTVTREYTGVFAEDTTLRQEFLSMIRNHATTL
jgi:GTP cyclohydrolase I